MANNNEKNKTHMLENSNKWENGKRKKEKKKEKSFGYLTHIEFEKGQQNGSEVLRDDLTCLGTLLALPKETNDNKNN